ncbi:hypothetical protein TSOC_008521 [Tetrabaena socialis]|uniref:Uncharacterized protein n=1 Tax=Tetrabaena socialis TaxID=47790 RepID=A0A2J7ZY95_9CHLO|nr:hypothetical protein TSOC_008521 [Tetrabaena socialis]|eukprot:PNH05232.1 hypothetical protein TSOC_008521 [Tetrabaena socialis]
MVLWVKVLDGLEGLTLEEKARARVIILSKPRKDRDLYLLGTAERAVTVIKGLLVEEEPAPAAVLGIQPGDIFHQTFQSPQGKGRAKFVMVIELTETGQPVYAVIDRVEVEDVDGGYYNALVEPSKEVTLEVLRARLARNKLITYKYAGPSDGRRLGNWTWWDGASSVESWEPRR